MNPNHRPLTSMPAIVAGLTLLIVLALTGLAPGSGVAPLPAGTMSGARATAALPLATNTPVPGTWSTTGSLHHARNVHTATLLGNGQVLVAGGQGSSYPRYLASAELYDPATGAWSTTDNLHDARGLHTATLLGNRRVLVAGGYGSSGVLASAELYDPATGVWTPTGSLNTARWDYTATLLSNGQVLVAGSCCSLSSAELYDPATGTWTYTGNLNTARYAYTATLLSNGQVLVAGGQGSSGYLSSAELYSP